MRLDSGEIVDCNRFYAEALGYDQPELLGRVELELYHPDSRDDIRRAMEQVERDGYVQNVQAQMVGRDGDTFDVSLSASAAREEGEVVGVRSLFQDVTELKQTQRDLRAKTERLEQSNEELEQFAYLASHDLQEPLRMVASYTQLLAKRYEEELDEQAQRYIDYAVEGAERMKALLSDLLEYSRVDRDDDEFERVELEDVIDVVEANLRVRIAEVGAEIEHDDLPAVHGSHSQLVQLMQNLVENALKFNESDSPRVEVAAEQVEGRFRVRVTDNGIGVDSENAGRIFQVFQRMNERGEYKGTGVGSAGPVDLGGLRRTARRYGQRAGARRP